MTPYNPPPTSAAPAPEQHSSIEHLLLRFGLVSLDQLSAALREQTETGTPFTEVLVRDGLVSADDLARVADRAPAMPDPEPEPEPEPPLAAEAAPPAFEAVVPLPEPQPEPVAETISLVPDPVAAPLLAAPPVAEPPVAAAPVAAPPVAAPPVAVAPVAAPPVAAPPVAVAPVAAPPVAVAPAAPPAPIATGFVVRGYQASGEEIVIALVDDEADAQRIARDAMRACARNDGADWPVLNGRYVRPESIVSIEVAERY